MKRVLALALALASAAGGMAQEVYPSRPIRIINPFPAGGAADVIVRNIGEALGPRLKQPVFVENRTGAAGMIGAQACKSAAPDGYTFCILLSDILVIYPHIYKNISYDAVKDFAPVVSLANVDTIIAAGGSVPAKDLKELAAWAKASRRTLTWSSYGNGSSSHLLLEQVAKSLGVPITNVPYQGGAPANAALLAGHVDLTLSAYGNLAQQVAVGAVKPMATLNRKRLAALPDTPTLGEQGVEFKAQLWQALFAPKGTPPAAIQTINAAVNEILRDPAFVARSMAPGGYSVTGGTPAELDEIVRQDGSEWGALAKSLNLRLD